MNRSLTLSVVFVLSAALVGTAGAQLGRPKPAQKIDMTKIFVPPGKGQQGWHPYSTPASVASMADSSIARLSNVWFGYAAFSTVPEGRARSEGVGYIVSPSKYHLEFITFQHGPVAIGQGVAIADGHRMTVRTSKGFTKPVPVGQANRLAGLNLPAEFPIRSDELMLAGLGNKQRPISAYVAAVSRPGSGYVVSSEARLTKGMSTASQYRLLIRRSPARERQLGQMSFELVFDAGHKLPVSGRVLVTPLKGKPTMLSWGVRWTLTPGQYPADAFTIPAKI